MSPTCPVPGSSRWGRRCAPDDRRIILALLLLRAFRASGGLVARTRPARWAFAVTALFAASDELHQAFVPTRGPSVVDVAIDCLGALIVLGGLALLERRTAGRPPT